MIKYLFKTNLGLDKRLRKLRLDTTRALEVIMLNSNNWPRI